MSRIALIPARGGSKRIQHKNIRPFLGKPIIVYSIEAAQAAGCFDEIMVSTDDAEIAAIARGAGATVPFVRSEQNADDHASLADVVREVLGDYADAGRRFDTFCCILATAPFLRGERIAEGLARLEESHADAVITVARFGYPIQRALKLQDGRCEMFQPENYDRRSNDLEPAFHDAGQLYWLRTEPFLAGDGRLLPKDCLAMELSRLEVQDIDDLDDWALAELKYRHLNQR